MGAAIAVFEGARGARSGSRFAPVKTTNDLLVVRSDAYLLDAEPRVAPAPERGDQLPLIDLDTDHFKLLHDFEACFPAGPLSLIGCDWLVVIGDVTFGREVIVRGSVTRSRARSRWGMDPAGRPRRLMARGGLRRRRADDPIRAGPAVARRRRRISSPLCWLMRAMILAVGSALA